jgi:glycosyltransferase involved in cell wall biosynthesis
VEDDNGVTVYYIPPRRIRIRRLLAALSHLPGLEIMREVHSGWGMVEASLGVWLAFIRLHLQHKFDGINVVDLSGLGFWGLISPVRPLPIVVRAHGALNPAVAGMSWPGSQFQLWLETICLRKADFVATNSHYLRKRYELELGVPEDRIGVIYNGFTVPNPGVAEIPDVRAQLGWDARDIVALYVGRIDDLKGSDLLFAALEAARRSVPTLRAVLIGDVSASFVPEYDEFMRSNRAWVWHPGSLPNEAVFSVARQATFFITPTRVETFGRVVVEAQLCGLPVIATNVGGVPEIVVNGRTGWLVAPESTEELTAAVLQVCHDLDRAQSVGKQGQAFAQANFCLDATTQQFEQLHWDLLNRSRSALRFTKA